MTLTITKSNKSTGLEDLADSRLFELMKNKNSTPEEARKAWHEFYKRYSKYLWNRCLRQCRTAPDGEALAKDIFQDTMQKVYNQAEKFDAEKSNGTKGWLSSIVHNEFYEYFRKHHLKFTNEELPDVAVDEEDNFIDDELKEKMSNLRIDQLGQLLSGITQKEHKILITYIKFQQLDKPNAHLPDTEMEKLCTEFNSNPEAIRQSKRRAIIKLKKQAQHI